MILHPPIPQADPSSAAAAPPARWRGLPGSSVALAVAGAAHAHHGPLLVVTEDTHGAQVLEHDLKVFRPAGIDVHGFPDWETLIYDPFTPHPDIVSRRIDVLSRLPHMARGILVIAASTLMQRLCPPSYLLGNTLQVQVGQRSSIESLRHQFEGAGYFCVSQVREAGEFAVRGSIVDVFPSAIDWPLRIEFFDDEVESIRRFDPESQRSEDQLEEIALLPAREYPTDPDALAELRRVVRNHFPVDLRRVSFYQELRKGSLPAGLEYYLPLFFEQTASFFDYLPANTMMVTHGDCASAADHYWTFVEQRYEQRRHDVERPVLAPGELLLRGQEIFAALKTLPQIRIGGAQGKDFKARPPAEVLGDCSDLRSAVEQAPGRVLLAADSPGRREALLERLRESGRQPAVVDGWHEFIAGQEPLALTVAPLETGFILHEPAVSLLTESDIPGGQVRQSRRRRTPGRDAESVIRDLRELEAGAPVVHEDHGVGRYQGLTRMEVGDMEAEFLILEYADGDKLYVPVASLHLISRYTGGASDTAPLHRLGGDQWARAKKRAATRVRDAAAELLDLYARREARQGKAFALDRALYRKFTDGFPFEETEDQDSAIRQVLEDLAAPRSMDRVVCGDVGFGKTEVALRAAYAVTQAEHQVAILVPTTLLAQQHFRNFADRFADWPIRVELLSRFRSKSEVQQTIADCANGKVDILIGTHRLLQKDIRFANLGLIIVDEEHRFGVRHKEQLRRLRAEVDMLTLTATPIPRTLNMSLSGIRDLSIIATPPAQRYAVKTFVGEWDGAQIREACLRELQRGGQIYFLHNEVRSIERVARELAELVPEASIRVAHGQMRERELESVMLDFYRQRFNVLVCTTIIESGIDIPTANTILINRADKLGMAQLHQLRGRVGRSHHRAYAYLIVPDKRAMTADARKRLDAIASLEDLGIGFTLATHDLEIRGAGELLGEEQSGQIHEIGFYLYMELLDRAVLALKEGREPDFDSPFERGCDLELGIPALIPDDYLPDVHSRLTLYKRIAGAQDESDLEQLQIEMIDRFGLLPEPAKNLFIQARLRQRADALGIARLEVGPAGGRLEFTEQPRVDPAILVNLVQRQPSTFSFEGEKRIRFKRELPEEQQRIEAAEQLLRTLEGNGER